MVDYLIIGSGLAGVSFAKELLANDKSFCVISDDSQQSSQVAGALYNPVILKRFTPVWKADEQLLKLHETFGYYEKFFGASLLEDLPVYRRFASVEEQNGWFEASDNPKLNRYLNTDLKSNTFISIDADFRFGKVNDTGRLAISKLISLFKTHFQKKNLFISDTFDYRLLKIELGGFVYKDVIAKNVIFCDGYGLMKNPYFNYLPLRGTKGELLVIKAPELKVDVVIKSAGFIIPLGNDLYKIGATYNHDDKNNIPSKKGRQELLDKIAGLIKCDFEIVNQLAGVRPTVADRRPLVGEHPAHKNMYILNGLGTRGVMIGPYAADILYKHIYNAADIPSEMNVIRFKKRWLKANA
ncbi:FAD-dependent oxidoreductase [Neptunitalea chrysea]|uniref:FAD-dependent oxidoreductase n=1 Tax=Neptunitalea chrysea TaxID=1647581 RepID=A0A9W6B377_9FLAO|nr:FAD-dependent oxidoreductase [Neptunitalea chrysea]GLB51579.1 FAD-dependent oxidoreductase [Neptunitalea chrysea]